uniref:DNA ligase ATP-dependent N-terminal domain-containing protein n=1 Tax=Bionectria ochroleuca TaxID=29856 RepID=A0A8H7NIJ6_BIOOC
MPSPAKKRKLNSGSKTPTVPAKGLEYFFSKQKSSGPSKSEEPSSAGGTSNEVELTDEELARKLQAEWNQEVAQEELEGESQVQQKDFATQACGETQINKKESLNEDGDLQSDEPTRMAEDSVTYSIPLDESPLTFDTTKYIGSLQEAWAPEGGHATYALLTRCFYLINATRSRIKIVDTLVNCLRILIEGDPSSLLPAVWLATNSISPAYISLELGLGGRCYPRLSGRRAV